MRKSVPLLVVFLLLVLAPVAAQEEPQGPITWIGLSKLKPGKSAEDAVKLMMEDQKFMDGLVANGTIVSYGAVTPINHHPGDNWNYGEFVSVESWDKVQAWVGAFMGYVNSMDDKAQKAREAKFQEVHQPGSHFDWVVRHVGFKPSTMKPAFFYLAHFNVKPGANQSVMGLFNDFVAPTMSKLQESGDMAGFGLYTPELHADHGWSHVFWYGLPSLAAVDKLQAAFEAAAGPAETAWAESVFDGASHYDKILAILHYNGPGASGQ